MQRARARTPPAGRAPLLMPKRAAARGSDCEYGASHKRAKVVPASLAALDELRAAVADGSSGGAKDAQALARVLRQGLLWLRPEAFSMVVGTRESGKADEDEADEAALLAYPSLHTCLVANVVALVDLLEHGRASRFARWGGIPPVYLSCAVNFERDDVTGELWSVEIGIADHQDLCRQEAAAFPAVREALDPEAQSDWLAYFGREFTLRRGFELWHGEQFVRNQPTAELPSPSPAAQGKRQRGAPSHAWEAIPVHGLFRSSLDRLPTDLRATKPGRLAHGGCVSVFRSGPPDAEPFGLWLGFFVAAARPTSGGGGVVYVDLQSHVVWHGDLRGLVATLDWDTPPRDEVFFAPFAPP
jgi:hypothetical protein